MVDQMLMYVTCRHKVYAYTTNREGICFGNRLYYASSTTCSSRYKPLRCGFQSRCPDVIKHSKGVTNSHPLSSKELLIYYIQNSKMIQKLKRRYVQPNTLPSKLKAKTTFTYIYQSRLRRSTNGRQTSWVRWRNAAVPSIQLYNQTEINISVTIARKMARAGLFVVHGNDLECQATLSTTSTTVLE